MKRPTSSGLLAALSALIVLAWVALKSTVITAVELTRAVLRLVADPVGEWRHGWKWLAIKVGLSVWVRELFTLAVARDIYAGAPAIYVNYLDYDVLSHAYGPRHGPRLRLAAARRRRHQGRSGASAGACPSTATTSTCCRTTGRRSARLSRRSRAAGASRRVIFEDFLTPHGAEAGRSRASGRAPSPRQRHQALRMGRAPGSSSASSTTSRKASRGCWAR